MMHDGLGLAGLNVCMLIRSIARMGGNSDGMMLHLLVGWGMCCMGGLRWLSWQT